MNDKGWHLVFGVANVELIKNRGKTGLVTFLSTIIACSQVAKVLWRNCSETGDWITTQCFETTHILQLKSPLWLWNQIALSLLWSNYPPYLLWVSGLVVTSLAFSAIIPSSAVTQRLSKLGKGGREVRGGVWREKSGMEGEEEVSEVTLHQHFQNNGPHLHPLSLFLLLLLTV